MPRKAHALSLSAAHPSAKSSGARPAALRPAGHSADVLDREALSQALTHGLEALSLKLSETHRVRLLDYLALLVRWNGVYNLTAIRDPRAMLAQHLLDCLAVVAPVQRCLAQEPGTRTTVLDVGSGAGLPAIPLAFACPTLQITAVEPVGKKSAFIRQAIAELSLSNAHVYPGRIQDLARSPAAQTPGLIISRAFASLADFIESVGTLADSNTWLAAMKGQYPAQEIDQLPPGWRLMEVVALDVPGLEAARHLVLMKRN
jgi:16S rRNA (guanine527-N7)-methyltransferase